MAYADLGKKIKAKYPQYQDMDDAELGKRMVAKYPEYSDFANDSKQNYNVSRLGVKTTPDMSGWQKFMAGFTQAPYVNANKDTTMGNIAKKASTTTKVTVPLVTGTVGRMALGRPGSIAGTAVGTAAGTAIGESIEDVAGVQDEAPMDNLKQAVKDTGVSTALVGVLEGLGLLGTKGKQLVRARNAVASNAKGTISGDKVLEHVMKQSENAASTDMAAVNKHILNAIDEYSGKTYSVSKAVLKKKIAGDAGYTATSMGKGGKAFVERAIASAFREEIKKAAPNVTKLDALIRYNILLNKGFSRTATQGLKLGGAATGLYAIGRMLGIGK